MHYSRAFKNTTIKSAKAMYKEKVLSCLKTYYTVLTVRHPFDRLESAYVDKVVLHNYFGIRETILQRRHIPAKAVKELAQNGHNVKFEEFLQHLMTTEDIHWLSISQLTHPCSLPYRYFALKSQLK